MDLALDSKQSRAFNCPNCDSGLQKLRNCGGQYGKSKSPMLVNGQVYLVCPRSLTFEAQAEQFLVSLYFDCRENKIYPFEGSYLQQTAYCKELFEYLDGIVSDFRSREHEKQMQEIKKSSSTTKTKK